MLLGVPLTAVLYRLLQEDLHTREGVPEKSAAGSEPVENSCVSPAEGTDPVDN